MAAAETVPGESMVKESEMDIKILECVECKGLFSLNDVQARLFFVDTVTCRGCYEKFQAMNSFVSCFGKPRSLHYAGYSATDPRCTLYCQDRKVCRQFVIQKLKAEKQSKSGKESE
jgi:hypothetical protein